MIEMKASLTPTPWPIYRMNINTSKPFIILSRIIIIIQRVVYHRIKENNRIFDPFSYYPI